MIGHGLFLAARAAVVTVAAPAPALASATGIAYNGSTQFRNGSWSGPTPAVQGLVSLWFRNRQATWNSSIIYPFQVTNSGGAESVSLQTSTSGGMQFNLTQDGTGVDNFVAPNGTFVVNQWYHILWSWKWGVRNQIYVNGAALNTAAYTFSGATKFGVSGAALTGAGLGCRITGANPITGDLAEVWADFDTDVDISVQANREKFAYAGQPVDLGANGAGPTGAQPDLVFRASGTSWLQEGAYAGLTLTAGTLAQSSAAPSY